MALPGLQRVEFDQGFATGDPDWVEVGDRAIPARIAVTLPSSVEKWPALRMTIEVRSGGAPECTELTLTAHPEGRPVRDQDFRHIRIDDWIETIVAEFALERFVAEDGSVQYQKHFASGSRRSAAVETQTRAARRTIHQARSGSRRKVTDELLERVAATYRANLDDRPVEAVKAALGTSHRTAARYVQLARASGHLPPTTRGRISG